MEPRFRLNCSLTSQTSRRSAVPRRNRAPTGVAYSPSAGSGTISSLARPLGRVRSSRSLHGCERRESWRNGTGPAAFRCGGERGGLACNRGSTLGYTLRCGERVKPTPLFSGLVFETRRFPRRIPSESAVAGSEVYEGRLEHSNGRLAQVGRPARGASLTASSAAFSNGVDWGGQAELAARTAIAERTSRKTRQRGGPGRAVTAATPRGVQRSTRDEGRTLKRTKAQGSIGSSGAATPRSNNGLVNGATP